MSVKGWFRAWGRLFFIHLSAIIAVWLGSYYPGLDLALSVVYLVVVLVEWFSMWQRQLNPGGLVLLFLVWHLPLGYALILIQGGFYTSGGLYYLAFVQQIWLTSLLPLLANHWPDIFTMGPTAAILYLGVFMLAGALSYYFQPERRTLRLKR